MACNYLLLSYADKEKQICRVSKMLIRVLGKREDACLSAEWELVFKRFH